jgi:hypothetical protein
VIEQYEHYLKKKVKTRGLIGVGPYGRMPKAHPRCGKMAHYLMNGQFGGAVSSVMGFGVWNPRAAHPANPTSKIIDGRSVREDDIAPEGRVHRWQPGPLT